MTDRAKMRELLDKYATVGTTSEELTQLVSLREKLTPALLSEVEKLRAALRNIATSDEGGVCDSGYSANHIARQALGETK